MSETKESNESFLAQDTFEEIVSKPPDKQIKNVPEDKSSNESKKQETTDDNMEDFTQDDETSQEIKEKFVDMLARIFNNLTEEEIKHLLLTMVSKEGISDKVKLAGDLVQQNIIQDCPDHLNSLGKYLSTINKPALKKAVDDYMDQKAVLATHFTGDKEYESADRLE